MQYHFADKGHICVPFAAGALRETPESGAVLPHFTRCRAVAGLRGRAGRVTVAAACVFLHRARSAETSPVSRGWPEGTERDR